MSCQVDIDNGGTLSDEDIKVDVDEITAAALQRTTEAIRGFKQFILQVMESDLDCQVPERV